MFGWIALRLNMASSNKCPTCEGRKFVVGFGGIRKPCKDCGSVVKSAPKKAGRPKQVK